MKSSSYRRYQEPLIRTSQPKSIKSLFDLLMLPLVVTLLFVLMTKKSATELILWGTGIKPETSSVYCMYVILTKKYLLGSIKKLVGT